MYRSSSEKGWPPARPPGAVLLGGRGAARAPAAWQKN